MTRSNIDTKIAEVAGHAQREAPGSVPTEPPPPRSPALRDQDLGEVIERALELAPARRLRVSVQSDAPSPASAKTWITRALQVLSGGAESGTAFATAPVEEESMVSSITARWSAGQVAHLHLTTVHPEPLHLVLLGESSAGEVTWVGDRIPVVTRGVPAQVSLGALAPGDHRFVVLALAQAPAAPPALLSSRLDDLRAAGLVSAAELTIIVA